MNGQSWHVAEPIQKSHALSIIENGSIVLSLVHPVATHRRHAWKHVGKKSGLEA
jgi:hypothetical protein